MGSLASKLAETYHARHQRQFVYFVSEAFSHGGSIQITRVVEVISTKAARDESEALQKQHKGVTWATTW
jgi:hypothetical protein